MQVLQRIQDCGFDVGDPDSEAQISKTHAGDVSKMLKQCGYYDDEGHSDKRKHLPSQSKQSNKKIRKLGKYNVCPTSRIRVCFDSIVITLVVAGHTHRNSGTADSDSDSDSEEHPCLHTLFEVGLYIILSIQFMVFKFGITADDPKKRVENAATYFGRGDFIFFKFFPIKVSIMP